MGLRHSRSPKVTSNGNQELAVVSVNKGRGWGHHSSYNRRRFYVFLSHSGKQKCFVRRLCVDLEKKGVICFFDERLPVGEDFTHLIFEAAKTCELAVLLISKEFLESRWPMLELSAAVKAGVKILPVFFMVIPEDLRKITPEDFKQTASNEVEQAMWHRDLNEILQIPGSDSLNFGKGGDEVEFRSNIVKTIWRMLPKHPERYPVSCMAGKERMCQEVANHLKNVAPNEKQILIVGLYGETGRGKTILAKAFCNFKLRDFEGNVCYLDFSGEDSFKRVRLALLFLTECRQWDLRTQTNYDQAKDQLNNILKDRRVLLVLDNISNESIDEVNYYVGAVTGKNSCIFVTGPSIDFLQKNFKIDSESCLLVPSLEESETVDILLETTPLEQSTLSPKDTGFARGIGQRLQLFHRLAIRDFGGHLFRKYGSDMSQWDSEVDRLVDTCGGSWDGVFAVLDKGFDSMGAKHRTIFMLLALFVPHNMSPPEVIEWLKVICNVDILHIKKAVEDLRMHGLIENFEDQIHISKIYSIFAAHKAERMDEWLWCKDNPSSIRALMSNAAGGFEFVKLQSTRRMPHQISPKFLQNLLVLELVDMPLLTELRLDQMSSLISLILSGCNNLVALYGMENLQHLAWFQISGENSSLKLPDLSSLTMLQTIKIHMPQNQVSFKLGDLTGCFYLRKINVSCPCLVERPKLHGLQYLEEVKFPV